MLSSMRVMVLVSIAALSGCGVGDNYPTRVATNFCFSKDKVAFIELDLAQVKYTAQCTDKRFIQFPR